MSSSVTEDQTVSEQLVHGSDHSIGEDVPGSPFALVGLSYLVVLLLVATVIIMVLYSFG